MIHKWYHYLEFRKRDDDSLVRRIPYVQMWPDQTEDDIEWSMKITIWDTKKFKMKGKRKFFSYKKTGSHQDAWDYSSFIEFQGFKEGWYDPNKVYARVTSTGREVFMEQYRKYNKRGK